ncbi:hypothetical protein [Bradyrhizobium sp. LMG 9283]|uniref:hypothetical protein n=1 Tax=Bradyrhizobium sp. LMG 9283 TaxID=592064 RepID=UPI003890226A
MNRIVHQLTKMPSSCSVSTRQIASEKHHPINAIATVHGVVFRNFDALAAEAASTPITRSAKGGSKPHADGQSTQPMLWKNGRSERI